MKAIEKSTGCRRAEFSTGRSAVFFFLLLLFAKLPAQDVHFSQCWMTPLLQNPGMAGANYDLQAIANYKDQWGSVASPYKTFDLSFDMKLNHKKAKKGFMAAGINVLSDKAGDSNMGTTQEIASVAYHIILDNKSTFGGGIMAGLAQRSISYSQLQWMNQYDGTAYNPALSSGEPAGDTRSSYANLGAGVVWAYKKGEEYISGNDQLRATLGVSVFQPHQPDYSFYNTNEKLHRKIIAHGNILYGIKNTNLCIVPGYNMTFQGRANEILFGSLLRYITKESSKYTGYVKGSAFSLGVYYRNRDALVPTFVMEMGQYTLGLSYDVNLSGLKTVSSGRGGFEISLRFVNPNPFLYKSASRI